MGLLLAYTPLHHLLLAGRRASAGHDQRQPLRGAHRLRGRGRPRAALGDRRPLPRPRPGHRLALRRLGGPRRGRAAAGDAAGPRVRARARCACATGVLPAGAGGGRAAQERLLPGARRARPPSAPTSATSTTSRPTRPSRRRWRGWRRSCRSGPSSSPATSTRSTSPPATRGTRAAALGVPLRRGAAPPRPRRRGHGRARPRGAGAGARLGRHRPRHGRDGLGWRAAAGRGAAGFERLATFRPVPLAGGDLAIREPWRDRARGAARRLRRGRAARPPPALRRGAGRASCEVVRRMLAAGLELPARARRRAAHSTRRARWRSAADHLALRGAGGDGARRAPPIERRRGGLPVRDRDSTSTRRALSSSTCGRSWRALVRDVLAGSRPGAISARFHRRWCAAGAELVRRAPGRHRPAAGRAHRRLLPERPAGRGHPGRRSRALLRVYLHGQVPPGDGGSRSARRWWPDAVGEQGRRPERARGSASHVSGRARKGDRRSTASRPRWTSSA